QMLENILVRRSGHRVTPKIDQLVAIPANCAGAASVLYPFARSEKPTDSWLRESRKRKARSDREPYDIVSQTGAHLAARTHCPRAMKSL
ncbi:MAG TPA: hypothetical protein VFG04_15235, partial [Planctomycetaceae bacterium]|nr:hypothetical protein [Planctomycetaceae bacterium]